MIVTSPKMKNTKKKQSKRSRFFSLLLSFLTIAGLATYAYTARTQAVQINSYPRGYSSFALGSDGVMWGALSDGVCRLGAPESTPLGCYETEQITNMVTGNDGNIWYTSAANNLVGKITIQGNKTTYPIPTSNSNPSGITVGPDGNIWFSEMSGDKIGRIQLDGTITEYPVPEGPSRLDTGPDDRIWFMQGYSNAVAFSLDGSYQTYPTGATVDNIGTDFTNIIAGSDGNMWFAVRNTIYKMSPGGSPLASYTLQNDSGITYPKHIASGPDGNLWVSMQEKLGENNPKGYLIRVTPSGATTMYSTANTGLGGRPNKIVRGPNNTLWYTTDAQAIGVISDLVNTSSPSSTPSSSGGNKSQKQASPTITTEEAAPVEPKQDLSASDDFKDGQDVDVTLKPSETVTYSIGSETHSATLKSIGDTFVVITLASTPFDVTLHVGETKSYDVSNDKKNDIRITLRGISNGAANLAFGLPQANSTSAPSKENSGDRSSKGKLILWIGVPVVVAGGLGCLAAIRYKKKLAKWLKKHRK
jgi:virginiamycin B lyase